MDSTLGVILTGGAARRMGGAKLSRRLPDGRRLIDVAAATLRSAGPDAVLAIGLPPGLGAGASDAADAAGAGGAGDDAHTEAEADPDAAPVSAAGVRLPTSSGPIPVVPDLRPGEGPLAGLDAGLAVALERGFDRLLVVPCDMPWLEPEDLRRLVVHSAAVVHPSTGGLPLAVDVTDTFAAAVRSALDAGRRRLRDLLASAGAVALPVTGDAIARHANVNAPADLTRGR